MSEPEREIGKRDATNAGVASPTATSGGSSERERGARERGGGQPRKRLAYTEEKVEFDEPKFRRATEAAEKWLLTRGIAQSTIDTVRRADPKFNHVLVMIKGMPDELRFGAEAELVHTLFGAQEELEQQAEAP